MDAQEVAALLRELVAEYCGRHEGRPPKHIYVSADIFASFRASKDGSLGLKKTGSRYTFDGVPIEAKADQALPFVLRP